MCIRVYEKLWMRFAFNTVEPLMSSFFASGLFAFLLVIPSSVVKLSPEQIYKHASVVAVVTPLSREARVVEENRIYTYVTVRVDSLLKGWAPPTCTITIPGGVVGGYGQTAGEAPDLVVGQKAVVYLVRDVGGGYTVVGGHQGVVPVQEEG